MTKLTIEIAAFSPLEKNTLRGFVTIRLPELRLVLHELPVHQHPNGKRWVSLPAKPMLDSSGKAMTDRETGKVRYVRLLSFDDKDVSDAFSARVLDALDAWQAERREPAT